MGEIFYRLSKKHEDRSFGGNSKGAAVGKEAEFHAAINCGEQTSAILEVEEADQRLRLYHVLKEELSGVVSRDPSWQDTTATAVQTE